MAAPKPDESTLFNAARRIDGPAARRLYVREACGDALALAGRLEALLRMHDEDPTFLASPAEDVRDLPGAVAAEGPGTRIGPYKLLRPIGEGGMGTVFLAEQTEPLRRQVAVKVVRPGMDSRGVLTRFEAERQALPPRALAPVPFEVANGVLRARESGQVRRRMVRSAGRSDRRAQGAHLDRQL